MLAASTVTMEIVHKITGEADVHSSTMALDFRMSRLERIE